MSNEIVKNQLTPEIANAIALIVSRGNYYATACKALGIGIQVFQRWMQIGEAADSGIYRDLYLSVERANAEAEIYAVEKWRAQLGDGNHAERFLARRHPDRWGEHKHITIAVEREIEGMLRHLQKRLPQDLFDIVINEMAEIGRERELEATETINV